MQYPVKCGTFVVPNWWKSWAKSASAALERGKELDALTVAAEGPEALESEGQQESALMRQMDPPDGL